MGDLGRLGVEKDRYPDAIRPQPADHPAQSFGVHRAVPAVVAGALGRGVGNQSALLGNHGADQGEERFVGKPFDIELPALLAGQGAQVSHIPRPGMTLIRTRMHGDTVGPGGEARPGRRQHVGSPGLTGVPEQGDLVEIGAERGHAGHAGRDAQAPRQDT